jgi:hypothetical protein
VHEPQNITRERIPPDRKLKPRKYSPIPQSRRRVRQPYSNYVDRCSQSVIRGTVGDVRALSLTAISGTLLGRSRMSVRPRLDSEHMTGIFHNHFSVICDTYLGIATTSHTRISMLSLTSGSQRKDLVRSRRKLRRWACIIILLILYFVLRVKVNSGDQKTSAAVQHLGLFPSHFQQCVHVYGEALTSLPSRFLGHVIIVTAISASYVSESGYQLRLDNMREYASRHGYDLEVIILEDNVLLTTKNSTHASFCVRRWGPILSKFSQARAEYLLVIDGDTLFENLERSLESFFGQDLLFQVR